MKSFATSAGYTQARIDEMERVFPLEVTLLIGAPPVDDRVFRQCRDQGAIWDPRSRFDSAVHYLARHAAGSPRAVEVLTELCPHALWAYAERVDAGEEPGPAATWALRVLADSPDPHSRAAALGIRQERSGPLAPLPAAEGQLARQGMSHVQFTVRADLRVEDFGITSVPPMRRLARELEGLTGVVRLERYERLGRSQYAVTSSVYARVCWRWTHDDVAREWKAALETAVGRTGGNDVPPVRVHQEAFAVTGPVPLVAHPQPPRPAGPPPGAPLRLAKEQRATDDPPGGRSVS